MAAPMEGNSHLPKYAAELVANARALVTPGKGILAADESTGTIGKRVRKHAEARDEITALSEGGNKEARAFGGGGGRCFVLAIRKRRARAPHSRPRHGLLSPSAPPFRRRHPPRQ
jgi:hypothetical protein